MSQLTKLPPKLADEGDGGPPKPPPVGPPPGPRDRRLKLHPYSGGLILIVDNACFGANAVTAGLATPLASLLAFCVTSMGVFLTQRFLDRDSFGQSVAKAFFSGVMAGIPTSIAGTIFGTAVMLTSGLPSLTNKEESRPPENR